MKKITFSNKIKSLDIDSKYIISSVNVNEIKDVVNSLSDSILEKQFYDIRKYKYIFINLPKNIDKKYDVEIEISEINDTNENNIKILKLSTSTDKFQIFENGIFKNLENSYISNSESNKILVADIEELILTNKNLNCKFRFRNILNNNYSDYFSIDLYPNVKNIKGKFIGNKFYTIADLKYKNHIAKLLDIGLDLDLILKSITYTFNEKTEINLYSFIYNGISIKDVSSSVLYETNDENIQLNQSKIEAFKTEILKRFSINSSINYFNENLTNKIFITINPIYLCDIEGTFKSENYVNQSYEISFFAKYSNQTYLNIKNDNNFNLRIKNGNVSYNQETGILTPLNENTIEEITISYLDHDFQNEFIEKTYILKINRN